MSFFSNKINRNVLSGYIVYIIIGLLNLISIPIFVKIIGIESYSIIGFFIVLQSFVGLFDFGLTTSLIRKISFRKIKAINDFKTGEILFVTFSIISFFIIFFLGEKIFNNFINFQVEGNEKYLIFLFSLSLSLKFQENIYKSPFFGYQKIEEYNYFLVIYNFTRIILTIYLISRFPNKLELFFLTFSLSSSIFIICIKIYIRKKLNFYIQESFKFNKRILIESNAFSTFLFFNSLITVIITQLDKILLANNISNEDFSYFIISNNLAYYILVAVTPIISAIFPRLSELYQENKIEKLKKTLLDVSELIGLFVIPGCVILFFSSNIFLEVFFNENISQNLNYIFKYLIIGYGLNAISLLIYNLYTCTGRVKIFTIFNCIYLIFYLPALIFLLPKYGYSLLICSWLILNSIYVFIMTNIVFNQILNEVRFQWFAVTIIKPFLISIIAVLLSKYLLAGNFNILFSQICIYLSILFLIVLFSDNLKRKFNTFVNVK